MHNRIPSFIAWLLCAVIIAAVVLELGRTIAGGNVGSEPFQLAAAVVQALLPITFALVGTLILSRQSRNVIGWLLILPALAFAVDLLTQPIIGATNTAPTSLTPLLFLALYVDGVSWVFLIFPLFLIALLFPTGRVVSPRWRWAVAYAIGAIVFFLVVASLVAQIGPVSDDGAQWTLKNPIGFITQEMHDAPW